jgi:hypothetical protein
MLCVLILDQLRRRLVECSPLLKVVSSLREGFPRASPLLPAITRAIPKISKCRYGVEHQSVALRHMTVSFQKFS